MLVSDLRPRGSNGSSAPSRSIAGLNHDPFSACMKCNFPLSGVTKLPKVLDDLSIVLNCGHVLCNKCVHMSDSGGVNIGRPTHCQHDFQCVICGLMSPPLTIPNCVRICSSRYTDKKDSDCKCDICLCPTKRQLSRLNNIAYCGIHKEQKIKFFCFQCGKHLCEKCCAEYAEDFKHPDHTLTEISKENPKLEDALLHGAVIHGNLGALEDEAARALTMFKERSENLRNTMGCYFIAIINAAIGRFCQIHASIQYEENKIQNLVETICEDIKNAKRRIEIGKEMDDLARSRTLMPEQFVADSYKISAQKIFREAVVLHNKTIKDVRSVKSHRIQFVQNNNPAEVVRTVTGLFKEYSASNDNFSRTSHIDPFHKLFSPNGQLIIEIPDRHCNLKEKDFSTMTNAEKLMSDGFSRFSSALAACGLRQENISGIHPTLVPKLKKEHIIDNGKMPSSVDPSSLTRNGAPLNVSTPMTTTTKVPSSSSNGPLHPSAVPSPGCANFPSPSIPKIGDDKAKKQEMLLQMIRGASGATMSGATANIQKTTPMVFPVATYTSHPSTSSGISSQQPAISNSRLKELLNANKKHMSRTKSPDVQIVHCNLPNPPKYAELHGKVALSKSVINFLYKSLEFKALTGQNQYQIIKQAQKLAMEDQIKSQQTGQPPISDRAMNIKLSLLIRKFRDMEKGVRGNTLPITSSLQSVTTANPIQMSRSTNVIHHPLQKDMFSGGVKSLAQIRPPIMPEPSSLMRVLSTEVSTSQMLSPNYAFDVPKRVEPPKKPAETQGPLMMPDKVIKIENTFPPKPPDTEEVDVKPDIEMLKKQMRRAEEEEEKKAVAAAKLAEEKAAKEKLVEKVQEIPEKAIEQPAEKVPKLETNGSCTSTATPSHSPFSQTSQTSSNGHRREPGGPAIQDGPNGRLILRLPRPQWRPVTPNASPHPSISDHESMQSNLETSRERLAELMPTLSECRLTSSSSIDADDAESVRTLDDDGTYRWCYVCNDEKNELLDEEKGICTTCPRVFHKACTIPRMRMEWSEDENWQCLFCKGLPPDNTGESSTYLTPRNRLMCQSILIKCFKTRKSSLLIRSFADPVKTLEEAANRLEEDSPNAFKTIDEFIHFVNGVLINSSTFNPITTDKGRGTQKVWMIFRKGVKEYFPEFLNEVWLYVSLYGNLLKRKSGSSNKNSSSGLKKKK